MSYTRKRDYASERRHKLRSRSRSTERRHRSSTKHRSRSRSRDRNGEISGSHKYATENHRDHKHNTWRSKEVPERHSNQRDNGRVRTDSKRLSHEDEYMELRRQEREMISLRGCPDVWGKSPLPEE